jgi:hypothetical protein
MNKKWYMSKTLWVNFLSFVAIGIQVITGNDVFSPEYQAMALAVINAILRAVTSTNLTVKK